MVDHDSRLYAFCWIVVGMGIGLAAIPCLPHVIDSVSFELPVYLHPFRVWGWVYDSFYYDSEMINTPWKPFARLAYVILMSVLFVASVVMIVRLRANRER